MFRSTTNCFNFLAIQDKFNISGFPAANFEDFIFNFIDCTMCSVYFIRFWCDLFFLVIRLNSSANGTDINRVPFGLYPNLSSFNNRCFRIRLNARRKITGHSVSPLKQNKKFERKAIRSPIFKHKSAYHGNPNSAWQLPNNLCPFNLVLSCLYTKCILLTETLYYICPSKTKWFRKVEGACLSG